MTRASKAKAPRCAKANFLTISDINPSFDSNQLPGTSFGVFGSDMGAIDVTKEADFISGIETDVIGQRFIGESLSNTTTTDSAPTVKNVTSLGTIRGLAPEEPTKQGSYYSAAVASLCETERPSRRSGGDAERRHICRGPGIAAAAH